MAILQLFPRAAQSDSFVCCCFFYNLVFIVCLNVYVLHLVAAYAKKAVFLEMRKLKNIFISDWSNLSMVHFEQSQG